MFLFRRVLVGDRERVLLIRKGRFERILEPGVAWLWALPGEVELERSNIGEVEFSSDWAGYLATQRPEVCAHNFVTVETTDAQVAVVYFDGKFNRVVGPGRRVLFWRGPVEVTATVIDARANPEVPMELAPALARIRPAVPVLAGTVDDGKTGLLFLDGRFVRIYGPGSYLFWTTAAVPRFAVADLRLQTIEIPGQEILTADKVSIRVNVWAEFRITDAVKATQSVKDVQDHLYRTLQLAVRQTLGRRTLETILAEKVDIDESVAAAVRAAMAEFGVHVGGIALKDIILPGEMREILNQVVTAEKQAQANLIRRREETAATRSLLNTARLMEDNPLLVRLKELETLEKVAEKVDRITIHGGFDTLLQRLITIGAEKGE